ncbi:PqqD family peptide modification chaperone [Haloimpatiens lingqiaonensis]|uniref:PqqD family peptide modification chaperone n=1 Tax=Haloimpatiens lingqiaonensis TaxID=1380675 RepID=UPI0010FEBC0E|nr:PqqD family peptide modification chaperone [Haloimpatiens lingqiaonensis]
MVNKNNNIKEDKNFDDNFLLYIPIKKHKYWEKRNGNVYLIFYHEKAIEKFLRWLVKKPAVSDIKLDKLGTAVWESMDGKNNIYDIGNILLNVPEIQKEYKNLNKDNYKETCHPIYERLIMYMRYLNKKGWISFKK